MGSAPQGFRRPESTPPRRSQDRPGQGKAGQGRPAGARRKDGPVQPDARPPVVHSRDALVSEDSGRVPGPRGGTGGVRPADSHPRRARTPGPPLAAPSVRGSRTQTPSPWEAPVLGSRRTLCGRDIHPLTPRSGDQGRSNRRTDRTGHDLRTDPESKE